MSSFFAMATDDIEPEEADGPPMNDSRSETKTYECEVCATRLPSAELVRLACDDTYCKPCLQKTFEMAMKDETSFPPRCCGIRIRANFARKYLPKSLLRKYKALQPELSTKDKTYCYRPTCSAFIPSHSIHNGNGLAICQKCFSVTCSECRGAWHWGPCFDGGDEEFFDLLHSKDWKRCPGCRRVVEKNTGCNHMTCRCGTEFCYICGEEMNLCRSHSEADFEEEDQEEEDQEEEDQEEEEEQAPE